MKQSLLVLFGLAVGAASSTLGPSQISGDVREFLSHVEMVDFETQPGVFVRCAQISGINVPIVNGTGLTETTNGAGNLIVGYAHPAVIHDRTGSHNLVGGRSQVWNSYGGLAFGAGPSILAPYCAVLGGGNNTASGFGATVTGGEDNVAFGRDSSVSGGFGRLVTGEHDWSAGSLHEDN